ncbi:MAG: hypothetical protein JO121_17675 [Deltaproteobacteria bacterium]|nr:hypothetical protein [Deltaproteobacteria bacterium]
MAIPLAIDPDCHQRFVACSFLALIARERAAAAAHSRIIAAISLVDAKVAYAATSLAIT